jgi:hypothetical protein
VREILFSLEKNRRWSKSQTSATRILHKGEEEMKVDYSELMVAIVDPKSEEVRLAPVFVAILTAIYG